MAARSILFGRRVNVAAFALAGTTALTVPKRTVYAEAPPSEALYKRKPIYDDLPAAETSPSSDTKLSAPAPRTTPRPTDRLAHQIGHVRLFVHDYAARSEDWLNGALSRGLDLESSFTRTIAGLAPDPATGERVLPGALYVAVATMAGSIVSRRRNILIRGATPLAAGIAAGWALLPYTTRNVADLVWRYEEKVPVIALNHMRVRGAVEQGWKETKIRTRAVSQWADQRASEAREKIEGWVRKGQ